MTLFLRDEKNNTVCECDFFTEDGSLDVSTSVSIINYTKLIVKYPHKIQELAQDFEYLDEVRGLLWELHTGIMGKDHDLDKAIAIVRAEYQKVANKFGLFVVED